MIRAVEKGEMKNFWKFKSKVKEEFENLISEMNFNKDDYSFEALDSSHANRSACLLALYGFKFMNAVETVWETATQKQLKEIGTVVALLAHEMNKKY